MSDKTTVMFLIVLTAVLFVVSNEWLGGSLKSQESLGREIMTSGDSLYSYRIAKLAPFKYRIVFPGIVKGSYHLLGAGNNSLLFFKIYRFWSFVFFLSAPIAFYALLRVSHFRPGWSFVGSLLFLVMPPVILAYTVPVHTREDMLGYSLLFLGLICVLKRKTSTFLIVSVVGVLCRETLMLLPLVYVMFIQSVPWWQRLFVFALPAIAWILIRFGMNPVPYDALAGFRWNVGNPFQVLAFIFISFNALWIPFAIFLFNQSGKRQPAIWEQQVFIRSAPYVLIILLLVIFFGGIFNEIRLIFPLVPWVIVVVLRFLQKHRQRIAQLISSPGYLFFLCAVFVALTTIYLLYHERMYAWVRPGKYLVPYHIWGVAFLIYFFFTVASMPAVLLTMRKPDPNTQ